MYQPLYTTIAPSYDILTQLQPFIYAHASICAYLLLFLCAYVPLTYKVCGITQLVHQYWLVLSLRGSVCGLPAVKIK